MWKQLQIVGKEHFNMALKSTNDLFLYAWDTEVLETEWKELEKSVAYFCIISHWFFLGGVSSNTDFIPSFRRCNIIFFNYERKS